jgi:hypothetical protein
MSNYAIKTPHAAVIIWNYDDRFGNAGGASNADKVEQIVLSTVSCHSVTVSKSKSDPQGNFQIQLAPTKNWVSTITAGSWCAILMSNHPIEEKDIRTKADYRKIKMFGKIESVRISTSMGADGQRSTMYTISGVDWGHIFNNKIYIDSRIPSDDKQDLSNALAIDINTSLFGDAGQPLVRSVRAMLTNILSITGRQLKTQAAANDAGIKRLASAVYNFRVPNEVVNYFQFIKDVAGDQPASSKNKKSQPKTPAKPSVGLKTNNTNMTDIVSLITGTLIGKDKYSNGSEAFGYINPLNLQGIHTFWQVLLEHSNPPLNEMIAEMRWEEITTAGNKKVSPRLTLYNRRKPFSLKNSASLFKNVRHHELDPVEVISIEAGTNWRDRYNFIEIKPNFEKITLYENWYKAKSQEFSAAAFGREGFRPLIAETRQFPGSSSAGKQATELAPDYEQLSGWSQILRQWYFDTHRMLNGTITLVGVDEYIAVGDNIKFDYGLINPTPNFNKGQVKKGTVDDSYILAHVENISHSFKIEASGARSYITTIQFVRGVLVNGSNEVIQDGILDTYPSEIPPIKEINSNNVFGVSEPSDPDPDKLKGT